jgi:hypothetical protein
MMLIILIEIELSFPLSPAFTASAVDSIASSVSL